MVGEGWSNSIYRLLTKTDIDIYSEEFEQGYLGVHVAEVKSTFRADDVGRMSRMFEELGRELLGDRRSTMGFRIKTGGIVTLRELTDRISIMERAQRDWARVVGHALKVECFDSGEMLSRCKKKGLLGNHYRNCIEFLRSSQAD